MNATVEAALRCARCQREWAVHRTLGAASTRTVAQSLLAETCCAGFAPVVDRMRFIQVREPTAKPRHASDARAF